MVMQMIHIHRDTNKLCSAVDLDLLEERNFFLNYILGTSLAVQWLRQCFTAGGMGSIPDWKLRSYMPHSMAKKKKKRFYCPEDTGQLCIYPQIHFTIPDCLYVHVSTLPILSFF